MKLDFSLNCTGIKNCRWRHVHHSLQLNYGSRCGTHNEIDIGIGHRFSHPGTSGEREKKRKNWGHWVRDRILVQHLIGGIGWKFNSWSFFESCSSLIETPCIEFLIKKRRLCPHIISTYISYIISNFIPISYIKTKSYNTTWYWGHDQKPKKAWDNHALTNKGYNNYTETYQNTLYTQTDKNTQEHTRHAPKWNQLYSDNKTDFSWFRKCLVVLHCFTV